MEVLEIIEMMEDAIDKSMAIPFIGRAIVDRDELLDLLQEIRLNLPDDLKQAKWVKEERQRILLDAQKEAAERLKNAEDQIVSLIDEHEITKKAYEQANQIITQAQQSARELRLGTKQYADDILAGIEDNLQKVVETIRSNREELRK